MPRLAFFNEVAEIPVRRAGGSSARLRSVMSRAIFEAPMIFPKAFLIGEMVSEISTKLPSLR